MTTEQVSEGWGQQGQWRKFTIDAGESLTIQFTVEEVDWITRGVGWICNPGASGEVSAQVSFDPDAAAANFVDHAVGAMTDVRGYFENSPIHALKFTASVAQATLTVLSSTAYTTSLDD